MRLRMTITVDLFILFDNRKGYETAFNFFERDACVSLLARVCFDTRTRAAQKLFGSQRSDDNQPVP